MKIRLQAKPVVSASALVSAPAKSRLDRPEPSVRPGTDVESGLLRLCEDVAGSLLRRHLEINDAPQAVREMRATLLKVMPGCTEARAGWIVDLALELIHVKANGHFKRNALELSELIARAGNQLREARDN